MSGKETKWLHVREVSVTSLLPTLEMTELALGGTTGGKMSCYFSIMSAHAPPLTDNRNGTEISVLSLMKVHGSCGEYCKSV